jgi:thiamine-monophosphate kinase
LDQTSLNHQTEFDIIRTYFKDLTHQKGVEKGIGDDAALVKASSEHNNHLVVATDTLIEGVHFPNTAGALDIAQRAMCVNLSDLAAMGAVPRWFTLGLTLPINLAQPEWLGQFSAGLKIIADQYDCALIGGDTTRGPLSVNITMLGEVPLQEAMCRDGASIGDIVYVTGFLGDGAAALKNELEKPQPSDVFRSSERLFNRFYRPTPRIKEGLEIRSIATACIDISDGLVADLEHLCRSSNTSANVSIENLPVHPEVKKHYPEQYSDFALFGGDDYELCFTVPESKNLVMGELIESRSVNAVPIGKIIKSNGSGSRVLLNGRACNSKKTGYKHFE